MSSNGVYPEHDKLEVVRETSQKIGEFLEWMTKTKRVHTERFEHDGLAMESPLVLAVYYPRLDDDPVLRPWVHGSHGATEELLAEFFEIDLAKLGREKQAMYQDLRHNHGSSAKSPIVHAIDKDSSSGDARSLCGQPLDHEAAVSTNCLKCIAILGKTYT